MTDVAVPHPRFGDLYEAIACLHGVTLTSPVEGLKGRVLVVDNGGLLVFADEATRVRQLCMGAATSPDPGGSRSWLLIEPDEHDPGCLTVATMADEEVCDFEDPVWTASLAIELLLAAWDRDGEALRFRCATATAETPVGPAEVHCDPDIMDDGTVVGRCWLSPDGGGDAIARAARVAFEQQLDWTQAPPLENLYRPIALWNAGVWLHLGVITEARHAVGSLESEAAGQVVASARRSAEDPELQWVLFEAHVVEYPDGRRELRVIAGRASDPVHRAARLPLAVRWDEAIIHTKESDGQLHLPPIYHWSRWLHGSLEGFAESDPELDELASLLARDLAESSGVSMARVSARQLRQFLLGVYADAAELPLVYPEMVVDSVEHLLGRVLEAGAAEPETIQPLRDLLPGLSGALIATHDRVYRRLLAAMDRDLAEALAERDGLLKELAQIRKEQRREQALNKRVEKRRKKRKLSKKRKKRGKK